MFIKPNAQYHPNRMQQVMFARNEPESRTAWSRCPSTVWPGSQLVEKPPAPGPSADSEHREGEEAGDAVVRIHRRRSAVRPGGRCCQPRSPSRGNGETIEPGGSGFPRTFRAVSGPACQADDRVRHRRPPVRAELERGFKLVRPRAERRGEVEGHTAGTLVQVQDPQTRVWLPGQSNAAGRHRLSSPTR